MSKEQTNTRIWDPLTGGLFENNVEEKDKSITEIPSQTSTNGKNEMILYLIVMQLDAIFIVRQLQEKYLARNKELWMAFVDLEKAFDRIPREVVWWALRCLGVDEWIVSVIKAMYATTTVRVNERESKAFSVRVGVHQGSVLSPLLFIIVLEALSREFRDGLPMELLYSDDLVLVAETEELLMEKLRKWKKGMELKGLRVNIGKTKVMRCQVRIGQAEIQESFHVACAGRVLVTIPLSLLLATKMGS